MESREERRAKLMKLEVEPYDENACNHKPTSKTTTLRFLSMRTFEHPPRRYGICLNCRKSFTFVEIEPGKFVLEDEYIENEK